jgi:hypothetical protein
MAVGGCSIRFFINLCAHKKYCIALPRLFEKLF